MTSYFPQVNCSETCSKGIVLQNADVRNFILIIRESVLMHVFVSAQRNVIMKGKRKKLILIYLLVMNLNLFVVHL